MKLSMWVLASWLEKYQPAVKIERGDPILRSARILSGEINIEKQNVYLARANEFITNENDKVICVSGHDMILLNTTDMDLVLNNIFDAFDFYNSWADGLYEAILDGCDLQYVIDESTPVFQEPLAIHDANHMAIALSSKYGVGDIDQEWDTLLKTGSNSMDKLQQMKDFLHRSKFSHQVEIMNLPYFDKRFLQRMLYMHGNVAGRIIMPEYFKKTTPADFQLLDMLGNMVELWMKHNMESKTFREETAIFGDLLDGQIVSKVKLDHKLYMAGWNPEHNKVLAKILIPPEYKDITYPLLARLENLLEDCYVFLQTESIYILVNLFYLPESKMTLILSYELKQSAACCGISFTFQDILQLAVCAEQCDIALQYSKKEKGKVYFCKEYALEYIRGVLQSNATKASVHPALAILREYDHKRNSNLYHTLYTYLINNCSLADTARQLSLHRNSLMHRLDRIRELTGIDTKDVATREYLYLSFEIMKFPARH
ncbi:helix-turn-helix domain-containing protein [Blautia liquoris]|uniref:Helix-turn-helix domain-containing protein n=1 Tax=Blautia liquoris TaxID=2779518 RepID=A0A7M2REX2_9FIRM|nr:helix-turn-helix domain-containing protein [Blautia liquoris]QOV18504.1 helix-turn-helix domain-containing protein [Blautia liquoris]